MAEIDPVKKTPPVPRTRKVSEDIKHRRKPPKKEDRQRSPKLPTDPHIDEYA